MAAYDTRFRCPISRAARLEADELPPASYRHSSQRRRALEWVGSDGTVFFEEPPGPMKVSDGGVVSLLRLKGFVLMIERALDAQGENPEGTVGIRAY